MGLLLLYGAIFLVLVIVQFARQGNFTRQIGQAVVSGQYRSGEGEKPASQDTVPLEGGASVIFGGLEFRLGEEAGDFALVDRAGSRHPTRPELMTVSGDSVSFRLPGGTELAFTTQHAGASAELQISGRFAGDAGGLDLPFRPLRSARVRESGDGQFTVSASGVSYAFSRLPGKIEGTRIPLRAGGAPVVYRAVQEKKAFAPGDFALPQVSSFRGYGDYISRWRDQSYSRWNQIVSGQNDEDLVIAYAGDSVRRGNYGAAVSAVPPAFLEGGRRTYESSVYLGNMTQARQSFITREREKIVRLSRQIGEKTPELLREPQVFEYLAARAYGALVDDGIAAIRSLDPSALTPELAPGVFEGWLDLKQYRPYGDNPFDRLIDQSCDAVSEGLRRVEAVSRPQGDASAAAPAAESRVFVFRGNSADMEFNLRLGRALMLWAETAGRNDWAGLGRSLVVSVLSLMDGNGTVPRSIEAAAGGEVRETAGARISGARLYRLLRPGEYYPRPALVGSGVNGIWAWTAAPSISASQENSVLDISVSFPPGETHYMMIRGIRPFDKIQLYNMDYRTDPEFERYDSSGWVYSAPDQILTLKMKHRAAVEHIRIFYEEP
jgi:hypothetical protein